MNASKIHPTAIIDPSAEVHPSTEIGPYCVIGKDCAIGEGTRLSSHVVVEPYTRIGKSCQIASGAVLGGLPQDRNFGGETSFVDIGDDVIIREYVTINRATGEGEATKVGDKAMIMAYCHLAHNCELGEGVVLANNVQMAGHVIIGEYAFISGTCLFHQFVKVGRLTIVAGFSGSRQDLPPFAMTNGRPQAVVVGINSVGLKRRGVGLESRTRIKKAFNYLWFSPMNQQQAIEAIRGEIEPDPYVDELLDFVQTSKRGIHKPVSDNPEQAASEQLAEMV